MRVTPNSASYSLDRVLATLGFGHRGRGVLIPRGVGHEAHTSGSVPTSAVWGRPSVARCSDASLRSHVSRLTVELL
jgi:hypothetical protein